MIDRRRTGRRGFHRALLVSAGALALLGAPACRGAGGSSEARPAAAASEKEPRKVRWMRARNVQLAETVKSTGTLAAQERVVVGVKTPGRLASIDVDLGSRVTKGQKIAQIDPVDYRLRVVQAEAAVAQARAVLGLAPQGSGQELDVEQTATVKQARATLDEATKNRERSQELLTRKLIGQADHDAVEANYARAESAFATARAEVYNRQALLRQRAAELALARQALSDTSILSTLDGMVQTRHVSAGELLPSGAPVVTVVRVDPLRLRLEIPDRAAKGISVGQSVQVLPSDGTPHEGRIARIAPAIDEQNRTLTVEAEVPNGGDLRPGSFVRAEVQLGASDTVVAVPARAVVVFAGLEKVLTFKDGKALELVVTTGRRSGELVEITRGLEAGTPVVVDPGNLQSGDAVEANGAEEASRAEAR